MSSLSNSLFLEMLRQRKENDVALEQRRQNKVQEDRTRLSDLNNMLQGVVSAKQAAFDQQLQVAQLGAQNAASLGKEKPQDYANPRLNEAQSVGYDSARAAYEALQAKNAFEVKKARDQEQFKYDIAQPNKEREFGQKDSELGLKGDQNKIDQNKLDELQGFHKADINERYYRDRDKPHYASASESNFVDRKIQSYGDDLMREGIPQLESATGGLNNSIAQYANTDMKAGDKLHAIARQSPLVGGIVKAMESGDEAQFEQARSLMKLVFASKFAGKSMTPQELTIIDNVMQNGVHSSPENILAALTAISKHTQAVKNHIGAAYGSDTVGSYNQNLSDIESMSGNAAPATITAPRSQVTSEKQSSSKFMRVPLPSKSPDQMSDEEVQAYIKSMGEQ